MTQSELAYIAGILDGEGCLEYTKKNFIRIKVKMASRETITYLRKITNLGCIYIYDPRITPEKSHYKILYTWQVSFNQARIILNQVIPYLVTKKDDAIRIQQLDEVHRSKKLKRGFYQP